MVRLQRPHLGQLLEHGPRRQVRPCHERVEEWKLPGDRPQAYSVWVNDRDQVWLTEWSSNAIVRFDPATEKFTSYPSNRDGARMRQTLGRGGEAWGAESGTDRLVRIK